MRKMVLFVFIVLLLVAFSGCTGETAEKTETKIKTDEGTIKMKTETSGDAETVTMEVETEEGTQTTTITGTAGAKADEWCPEGGNWEMQTAGVEGEATATWKIDKLETSGKYAGLCHVIYTAQTPDGEMKIDYWFAETGEHGFYEMDVAGQKISQEWPG